METFLSSFVLVALSEMGDKTQLLAFSLATRFKKPLPILAGIFVATLLNHGLASTLGVWVAQAVPPRALAITLGLTFIAFGIWALKPDKLDDEKDSRRRMGPFLTTLILFFLAEMGDKTQLATIALGARFHSAVLVTVGTTLGMMASNGLAVVLGNRLAQRVSMKVMRMIAAGLFFVFGAVSLWQAA